MNKKYVNRDICNRNIVIGCMFSSNIGNMFCKMKKSFYVNILRKKYLIVVRN